MQRHKRARANEWDGRHLHRLDLAWLMPAYVRWRLHRVGPSDVQQPQLHQHCDVRRVSGGEFLRGRVRGARSVLEWDSLHGRLSSAIAVPGGELLQQFECSDALPCGVLLC